MKVSIRIFTELRKLKSFFPKLNNGGSVIMEMSQNDVDALFKAQRVEDAIPDNSPLACPLEPLKTFRKFIDETRGKIGKHLHRLKDKETQLIQLHKQTVNAIKETRKINKEALDFFQKRRKDYEAMINYVLKNVRMGRILVPIPSFGSLALKQGV